VWTSNRDPRDKPADQPVPVTPDCSQPATPPKTLCSSLSIQCCEDLGFLPAFKRYSPLLSMCPRCHHLRQLGRTALSSMRSGEQQSPQGEQLSHIAGEQRSTASTACLCRLIPLGVKDIMTAKQPVGNRHRQSICPLAFLPLIFLEHPPHQKQYLSITLRVFYTDQSDIHHRSLRDILCCRGVTTWHNTASRGDVRASSEQVSSAGSSRAALKQHCPDSVSQHRFLCTVLNCAT